MIDRNVAVPSLDVREKPALYDSMNRGQTLRRRIKLIFRWVCLPRCFTVSVPE
jgi:hypothetical protein